MLTKPKIIPPLSKSEKEAYRIKRTPLISDWAEKNIRLIKGCYSNRGRLRLHAWQREPVDAPLKWATTLFLGPTQTGKSLLADLMIYFSMAVLYLEGLVLYCNEKIALKVFRRRIKPMIQKNPVLRKEWSGSEDDLSIKDIRLKNVAWGVGSAQNRNDIASFPAGCEIWSEASKAEDVDYDVYAELEGRQESYTPDRRKKIIETTPNYKGDPMYVIVYADGTLILEPHVKCPLCGAWQVLIDEQIKLRKIDDKEPDHSPHRIRVQKEKAVWYECPHCNGEIRESDRPQMFEWVVWAAPEIEERVSDNYVYRQSAEEITPDGQVIGDRSGALRVCYHWNRLVDPNYTFWECLARFFDAHKSSEKMHVYLNNDMARFWVKKSERVARTWLEAKALKSEYFQGGDDSFVPEGVVSATIAMDTQDKGWWYTIVGWGQNLESWRLRVGWIACDMHDERFKDRREIVKVVTEELFSKPLLRKLSDGRVIPVLIDAGAIDRGGHRHEDVDFLCSHMPFRCKPYFGATRDDPKKELIYETDSGHLCGKTELLSEKVGALMVMESFRLPHDIPNEYFSQVIRQYHYTETLKNGNQRTIWKHGGEDHLRDCENMNYGVAHWIGLTEALFNANAIASLRERMLKRGAEKAGTPKEVKSEETKSEPVSPEAPMKKTAPKIASSFLQGNGGRGGSYFGGGRF